jgi:hypothetical protein
MAVSCVIQHRKHLPISLGWLSKWLFWLFLALLSLKIVIKEWDNWSKRCTGWNFDADGNPSNWKVLSQVGPFGYVWEGPFEHQIIDRQQKSWIGSLCAPLHRTRAYCSKSN